MWIRFDSKGAGRVPGGRLGERDTCQGCESKAIAFLGDATPPGAGGRRVLVRLWASFLAGLPEILGRCPTAIATGHQGTLLVLRP
jgi:hypothetical protein